jgi:hypothetical protein
MASGMVQFGFRWGDAAQPGGGEMTAFPARLAQSFESERIDPQELTQEEESG